MTGQIQVSVQEVTQSVISALMSAGVKITATPTATAVEQPKQVAKGKSRNFTDKELANMDLLQEAQAFCDRMNAKPKNPASHYEQSNYSVHSIANKSVRVKFANLNKTTQLVQIKSRKYVPFCGSDGSVQFAARKKEDNVIGEFQK